MPAIIDAEGPDGEPIPVFESGAMLQYPGRKFGKFYPSDERARTEADQWLFWQMGGLGPMAAASALSIARTRLTTRMRGRFCSVKRR